MEPVFNSVQEARQCRAQAAEADKLLVLFQKEFRRPSLELMYAVNDYLNRFHGKAYPTKPGAK